MLEIGVNFEKVDHAAVLAATDHAVFFAVQGIGRDGGCRFDTDGQADGRVFKQAADEFRFARAETARNSQRTLFVKFGIRRDNFQFVADCLQFQECGGLFF